MNIVFFTRNGFETNELFLYMYARISERYPRCPIVTVNPREERHDAMFQKRWRKIRRLGWRQALEILSSYPLQCVLAERDQRETAKLLSALTRREVNFSKSLIRPVSTVNGPDAVEAIRSIGPDVLIQAGAGILKPQIFRLPRIACLNMHHGIAPLIRGMNSICWGLYESRPEWIGCTVHEIDEGIDTGHVLGYAPVHQTRPGEGFPALFARATEQGVERLIEVLERLEGGERWSIPVPEVPSAYRSTMSGWKLAALQWRLHLERKFTPNAPGERESI